MENKKKGKTSWVTKRIGLALGEKHLHMLEELIIGAQKINHRANMTTVIEDAIECAYIDAQKALGK